MNLLQLLWHQINSRIIFGFVVLLILGLHIWIGKLLIISLVFPLSHTVHETFTSYGVPSNNFTVFYLHLYVNVKLLIHWTRGYLLAVIIRAFLIHCPRSHFNKSWLPIKRFAIWMKIRYLKAWTTTMFTYRLPMCRLFFSRLRSAVLPQSSSTRRGVRSLWFFDPQRCLEPDLQESDLQLQTDNYRQSFDLRFILKL